MIFTFSRFVKLKAYYSSMLNQISRQNLSACEYLDINQSKDSKASEARQKQHKILLFKLNKHSHPHYLLQKSQTCEIKDQQNLERTAYTVKSESHQKMHSKFKPKEKTKRLNIKQTSKMKKQNSQMLDEKPKLSMTQSVGSKWREQHREQKSHFMKMILFIDRKDKRCSLKQSVQNLIILGSSITKVKILIYKHYKAIIVHKEQHQMNNIKYYCLRLFSHFKELIGLIENNVDKNQNYKKYVRSLKKFEPSISKQTNSFEQHLQCLLFYFSSVIELKRFYEVCANSDQFIAKILPEDISSITNHIVRIRHYLGYLAKFIVNPLMQNSPAVNKKSVAGQDNIDIWKYIYQKKYTAKVGKHMSK